MRYSVSMRAELAVLQSDACKAPVGDNFLPGQVRSGRHGTSQRSVGVFFRLAPRQTTGSGHNYLSVEKILKLYGLPLQILWFGCWSCRTFDVNKTTIKVCRNKKPVSNILFVIE